MLKKIDNERINTWATRNLDGIEAEKNGDVEAAVKLYESNVAEQADTPHSYKRLAIIYRKQKRYDDEISVLKKAISVFSRTRTDTSQFKERLEKAKQIRR